MHRLRYHPYAVPDRHARHKAFDAVAYVVPPCVVNVFFPSSPAISFDDAIAGGVQPVQAPSVTPAANIVLQSPQGVQPAASGSTTYITGTRPAVPNSLGLDFPNRNVTLPPDRSASSAVQFTFASDDDDSQTGDSSVPPSPVVQPVPLTLATALSPLLGLGNLPNFARALHGQEPASALDLSSLEEVINELEPPEGGEASLVRSDSGILLGFSLAMQRRSRT